MQPHGGNKGWTHTVPVPHQSPLLFQHSYYTVLYRQFLSPHKIQLTCLNSTISSCFCFFSYKNKRVYPFWRWSSPNAAATSRLGTKNINLFKFLNVWQLNVEFHLDPKATSVRVCVEDNLKVRQPHVKIPIWQQTQVQCTNPTAR